MKQSQLKAVARSINSIGLYLYFVKSTNYKKFSEINKPLFHLSFYEPERIKETFIITQNKLKESNIIEPFDTRNFYNILDAIQEITPKIKFKQDDEYVYVEIDDFFSYFCTEFPNYPKAVCPNLVITDKVFNITKDFSTKDYIRFYSQIPQYAIIPQIVHLIYNELLSRPTEELEKFSQEDLAKIFLKLKDYHSVSTPHNRLKFENLFDKEEILEKIAPYCTTLEDENKEENPASSPFIQYMKEHRKDNTLFFSLCLDDISGFLSKPEFKLFKSTWNNVLSGLVEFYGYETPSISYPSKGEILACIYPKTDTLENPLTIPLIWEKIDLVYKLLNQNNIGPAELFNTNVIGILLQKHYMEQDAPINNATPKPTSKF